jgi:hypothetical protein
MLEVGSQLLAGFAIGIRKDEQDSAPAIVLKPQLPATEAGNVDRRRTGSGA